MAIDEEWVEYPFDEVIDFQEGPGILAKDFRSEGTPLVRLAGLESGRSVLDGCNYLDPEVVRQRWSHFALKEGDVLLSTSASLGRVAVVGKEAVGAIPYTGIIRMRPRDGRLHAPFIRYLLAGPDFQRQAEMVGVGSVIRHFGPMHLRQMSIRLPPVSVQRAIAHVLGTLDDKIELNRRMSETLESIARALFQSWFVDFDPVRAKSEGRSAGLPESVAGLFPSRLVRSELGHVPHGWGMGCVGDEFSLTMGQSPPGSTYNEVGEGLPFFQGRADFGSRFPSRRVYCTAPTRTAKAGATLVSVRAPVGDINMAVEDCAIGRGVAAVRHKSGSRWYSYHFMRSIKKAFAVFEAEGTVFGSIGKRELQAIACVRPPYNLVLEFERRLSPIHSRIEANEREIGVLRALRDALLPKLLSGELRLRRAEQIIERST